MEPPSVPLGLMTTVEDSKETQGKARKSKVEAQLCSRGAAIWLGLLCEVRLLRVRSSQAKKAE